jgi:regulator of protease activity HflC (stomatin/prohibitin superfamily)
MNTPTAFQFLLAASGNNFGIVLVLGLVAIIVVALLKTARVVPQRQAHVVERLGKYHKTLEAGFHILIPFIDRVAYKHSLKEVAMDVPPQFCITKDNIAIEIDGLLYMQVLDPKLASYGIENYYYAASQLAQTTLRSEIGKLELDKTFEERDSINASVIAALDKASEPWGLKITRYEIANIKPPQSVQDALEKQMRAERERRAQIALSEGQREAQINVAEGQKQEVIKQSEAKKLSQINEAEGKAREIELLANATAEGIVRIAQAIQQPGGKDAVNLRIAEQYVIQFGNLAKETNTMILPQNLSDIGGTVAALAKILDGAKSSSSSNLPGSAPPPLR